ncbi:YfjI family protein [Rhodanobacter sp. A1T4]|uniref:YfjI family protein n=1 Tax=Rhodanobacter sp. A1T4 TaxID=2723087 RepID=UPI001607F898|nr:YfjI family protein [Rhodanobacter sp. A1T4]MBB6248983.1 hypothetical protein [Rhodanobacter sp. A1T4]
MYRSARQFPINALPLILRDALLDLQEKTKVPIELCFAALLGSLSLAFAGHINVQRYKCKPSSVGLFIFAIAESGERKSALIDGAFAVHETFIRFVRKKTSEQKEAGKAAEVVWKIKLKSITDEIKVAAKKGAPTESLQEKLEEHFKKQIPRPFVPEMRFKDVSPERLAKAVKEWPSVGIIAGEGEKPVNGRAFQDLSLLTEAWDGAPLKADRVDDEADYGDEPISQTSMTIMVMLQASAFEKFMRKKGEQALGLGLFARPLFCNPPSTQGTRYIDMGFPYFNGMKEFDERLLHVLIENWKAVTDGGFERKTLKFSPDAEKYWIIYFNNIEAGCSDLGEFSDMKAVASKLADNMARLAALFAYLREDTLEISLEDAENADQVLEYFIAEYQLIFCRPPPVPVPQDQADATRFDHWFRDRIGKRTDLEREDVAKYNLSELQRCGPYPERKSPGRVDAALRRLKNQDKIWIVRDGKSVEILCNPRYFGHINNFVL